MVLYRHSYQHLYARKITVLQIGSKGCTPYLNFGIHPFSIQKSPAKIGQEAHCPSLPLAFAQEKDKKASQRIGKHE